MKRFILLLFLFANIARMSAQTFDIKGTVYDESNKPLPGCSVHTSESRYTMSDSLGRYSIPVSLSKDVDVYYEYLGYRTLHIVHSPERSVSISDVRMVPDSVVFGQTTVKAVEIPNEVEYVILYTQFKKKSGVWVSYPYVIKFMDKTGKPIFKKEADKLKKTLKNVPAADFVFEGFELTSIGSMLDDLSAQRASAEVARQGFHDYGRRDHPVCYFKRKTD